MLSIKLIIAYRQLRCDRGFCMTEEKIKVFRFLSDINHLKRNVVVKGIFSGAIAGLLTVLYRLIIEYGTKFATQLYAFFRQRPVLIPLWVLAAVAAGLLVARLIKLEPMATSSGIPQVEGVVLLGLKMKWYTIMAVRFLSGAVCGLFGLSLGREGPSIQIGAAGGQAVAKVLGKNRLEENYLITGGAAAGLAAAFNAPISGVIFALEEVHRNFSPVIMLAATAASLAADFVSKYFLGLKPDLDFTMVPQLPIHLYAWLIPLGLLSGLVGSLMNKSLLGFGALYQKLPVRWVPTIAMLTALPCGMFFPLTLGSGQDLIKFAENAKSGILALLVLFAVKLLFTGTSFSSGVPGGIFMPILSVGTISGSILGILAVYAGLPDKYIPDFAVCAMAGALAASVKAPITAILLTAEMSGSLVHLLPVAACAFLALFVSDALKIDPIYEALLERFIRQNKKSLPEQERKGFMEIPVELGSPAAGKRVNEIQWPSGALVANLRRGTREIIPHGNTQILPGDYLVILFAEEKAETTRKAMSALCHAEF